MVKIHPPFVEEVAPVTDNTLHGGACVKLHAKHIKNKAKVRREVRQGGLVNLKGVVDRHAWCDFWVQLGQNGAN